MLKKALLGLTAIVCTLTVVYASVNHNLNAFSANTKQQVTGTIALKNYDSITSDIKYEGNDISWDLIKDTGSNHWFMMTMQPIANNVPLFGNFANPPQTYSYYSQTNLPSYIKKINDNVASAKDYPFIIDRTYPNHNLGPDDIQQPLKDSAAVQEKKVFHVFVRELSEWLGIAYTDVTTDFNFWIGSQFTPSGWSGVRPSGIESTSYTINDMGVRPSMNYDLSDVVFAISEDYGTSLNADEVQTVEVPVKDGKKAMKLRRADSTLAVTLDSIKAATKEVQKIALNTDITIAYDHATTGNDHMISALFVGSDGQLKYYKQLTTANSASGSVTISTKNMAVGDYSVYLINEIITNDNASTYSSSLGSAKSLSIVEPHKLSYTKQPQSGASSKDYEFGKNANAGQTVGKISVNPQGIMPITYTVVSNGDNSYQNFEIDGLDDSNSSSSTSLNVKIKNSAPDLVGGGLKAGSYQFCISAVDANGYPTTATLDSKVCTSFTVAKTKLSVAFDETNTTKKSIKDASTAWNEKATVSPTTGVKVTYSVSSGDIGLIDIDANTGAITYKGGNAFGKVKIKATADDDPSSGNDNYDPIDTEKEIVIYQGVDGNVTPDNNSSDNTTPTFSASDANVKINGIIGTIKGTLGTPDTIGGNTITYTYGLKEGVGDANFFSVDPTTGIIKSTANLGVKGYSITVTVSDKWSTKEIPVTINVGVAKAEDLKFYESSTSNTVITTQSAKITDTNVFVYATVKGSSNTNPVTYKVKDGSTNVVEVNPSSGKIDPKGVGSVTIVAEKAGASGQAKAVAELTFTVTAGEQDFIYTDVTLSNELPKTGNQYDAKEEGYEKGKTFQLYTAGYPTGATVTYQLKAGSPTDVISVDSNGLVHILNASISPSQIGKVIVEATSHDPSGSYSDKTIELPINITKANQTISFKEITYVSNGSGSVAPVIIEQDISSNEGGVNVADTDYYISVDTSITSSIAYTNDGKTIHYDYTGESGLDIPLHVVKQGNRNYEKAEADGKLHIMGPNENILATTNVGRIVYGDHFEIKSLQDDSSSTNVQYQFEVDDTTYLSNPTVNGNKAEFDALKFSGNTTVHITVTRTADTEKPLSKTISVQVLPKEIEITIDDKEKYKGEENPTLTYQDFKLQLVSWGGVPDVIQEHDIKLSTTAQTNSQAGSYPIKGDANSLNNTYPNYNFKFVDGALEVKEDNIEDSWYHMEIADGSHTPYSGDWTNQDVTIISDHTEYINLSLDQSTWNPQKVTVSKEGETSQSFWMKKDSGAITKEKQEIIRIDKIPPKVKGIKAKDSNNKLQDMINQLSGGIFFKPGTTFDITTSDENGKLKVCGTKEISYKVYKLSKSTKKEISNGTLSVTNEKASFTINETTGTYRVCMILSDHAGNISEEACREINIRAIGIDSDGDGIPDINIDIDGDGIPDINVTKNPNDPEDKLPYLNIDTDGDGKPDMNIDTDGDGIPNLNTGIIKEWHPDKLVDMDNDDNPDYKTDATLKGLNNIDTDGDGYPDLNLDLDLDGLPELNINTDGKLDKPQTNIDSDGDGIPDINIDVDGDGKPDKNIMDIKEWNPNHNVEKDGKIVYDTMNFTYEKPIGKPNNNQSNEEDKTGVQVSYYQGNSIGGANTGDTTNLMLYGMITQAALIILCMISYKRLKSLR